MELEARFDDYSIEMNKPSHIRCVMDGMLQNGKKVKKTMLSVQIFFVPSFIARLVTNYNALSTHFVEQLDAGGASDNEDDLSVGSEEEEVDEVVVCGVKAVDAEAVSGKAAVGGADSAM